MVAGWDPYSHYGAESSVGLLNQSFPAIEWLELDTLKAFREYALQIVKFNKVYDMVFENHVLKSFILAAPGLSEAVIGGKLWDIYAKNATDLLIVDLPASGHALSFFQSPLGLQKIFKFGFIKRDVARILELFESPSTRLDLVALPEELALEESRQLKEEIDKIKKLRFGFLHLNQMTPDFGDPKNERSELQSILKDYQNRREEDERSQTWAKEQLGLPIVCTKEYPSEKLVDIIQTISTHLESAE